MPDTLPRTIALVQAHLTGHRPAWRVPEVSAESSFERDLACDPIDMVCVLLETEEEFSIELPARETDNVETVGDLADLVTRLRAKEAA